MSHQPNGKWCTTFNNENSVIISTIDQRETLFISTWHLSHRWWSFIWFSHWLTHVRTLHDNLSADFGCVLVCGWTDGDNTRATNQIDKDYFEKIDEEKTRSGQTHIMSNDSSSIKNMANRVKTLTTAFGSIKIQYDNSVLNTTRPRKEETTAVPNIGFVNVIYIL